jgi:hypothetical protein
VMAAVFDFHNLRMTVIYGKAQGWSDTALW